MVPSAPFGVRRLNVSNPLATATATDARRPRSIAVYLFVLALVALVPAFAFSAILLQRNNEAQERVVETLITGSTRSIMQAVDREVYANISTLKVLATDPDARRSATSSSFYNQVQDGADGHRHLRLCRSTASFYAILSTTRRLRRAAGPQQRHPERADKALRRPRTWWFRAW